VLEHVSDLDRVIAETARVLKPGGVYLFDTVNRTLLSRLVVIGLLQEWEATRILPPNLHAWEKFIKPAELRSLLARHGLEPRQIAGLGPPLDPIRAIRLYRALQQGRISYGEMGRRLPFRQTRMTWASYMGYAVKPG
jgi:2-polyprenyl-6-hydroxyphenyl methylase/3-demethylubiquinone-9 3-methyltransferase